MKYSDIRESLNTGDIVLFSGNGYISTIIQRLDQSKWSHVGILLKFDQYDSLLLFESTTLSNLKDVKTNSFIKGVQTVPFSQRLTSYDGEIAIRKLVLLNEDICDRNKINEVLMKFRYEVNGRPYEQNRFELIKSLYDGPFGLNAENLSSIFCSELVAECYQRIGLLDEDIPSNEYVPSQFSSEHFLKLNNACLTHEIIIN